MCRGMFRTSSLASSIVCCNVGAWTIFTKGFTFTRNVCHRRKMWTGFGCIDLRSFENPCPTRRDSGLGKSSPSFDSSSEEPWRDSFGSPISSLRLSHKVLSKLARDTWNGGNEVTSPRNVICPCQQIKPLSRDSCFSGPSLISRGPHLGKNRSECHQVLAFPVPHRRS